MPRDCYDCCPVPAKTKKPKSTKPKAKKGGYISSDCSCSDCMSWSDSCSCSDCEPRYSSKKKKTSGKNKGCDDCSCSDCELQPKTRKKKTAPKRKPTKTNRKCL